MINSLKDCVLFILPSLTSDCPCTHTRVRTHGHTLSTRMPCLACRRPSRTRGAWKGNAIPGETARLEGFGSARGSTLHWLDAGQPGLGKPDVDPRKQGVLSFLLTYFFFLKPVSAPKLLKELKCFPPCKENVAPEVEKASFQRQMPK